MENVFEKDGFVYLKTGLSPAEFAKSRGGERLAEKGAIATLTTAGWLFSAWSFTETEEDCALIFVKGKAFSGQTLRDYFSTSSATSFSPFFSSAELNKAKAAKAAALFCEVTEASIDKGISLPDPGAGGIFISDDFTKVIFFPEQIFLQAALRFSSKEEGGEKEFALNRAFYVNPKLSSANAIRFTQAVTSYRALTGDFPFTDPAQEKLSMDIEDNNFIPLRNRIWAIDEELASFVDNALQRKAEISSFANAKQSASSYPAFPLSAFYRELGLTAEGSIPKGGTLLSVIRKSSLSPEDFERAVKKEAEKSARALRRKRFFRRYKSLVIALTFAAIFALALSRALYKSYRSKPSTKGLSALQTVEIFYSAYNTLDLDKARCTLLGKQTDYLVDVISQAYVTNQTRSAYSPARKTVTPAEWMNYNNDGRYYMFGLTGFAVNEQKMELFAKPPLRKQNLPAVLEEGGKRLREGDSVDCHATYFFVYPESEIDFENDKVEEKLHIEEYQDSLTLLFKNECWRIIKISRQKRRDFYQDSASFYEDYKRLLDSHKKDILLTANDLRHKYTWISDNSEILSAAQKLREEGGRD